MKKIKLMFAFLAICFAAVSCIDKEEVKDAYIPGKWKATSYSYSHYVNGKLVSSETNYYADYSEYFQFNADGTGQHVYTEDTGSGSEVGTIKSWVLLGNQLVVTFDEDPDWDDITVNFIINTLNRSDMEFSVFVEETEDGDKIRKEFKYTLRKI